MASTDTKLDLLLSGLRGVAWEEAKGALRTAYMAVGTTTASRLGDDSNWIKFRDRAEQFIKSIEQDGLHE